MTFPILPFGSVTIDSELFALVRAVLIDQFPSGFTEIKQSFQGFVQGANTANTIYIFKVTEARSGWQGKKDKWNVLTGFIDHVESVFVETTVQFTVMVRLPAQDWLYAKTSSDVARMATNILQSDFSINKFQEFGVGILEIKNISNPFFNDEQSRFEAAASFDVVFRRSDILVSTVPEITAFEAAIKSV